MVVFGFALAIVAPIVTGRRLWERLGGAKLFSKLLKSKWSRRKLGLIGWGLKHRAPTVPTEGEHTEIALGRAVDDMYRALPAATRERLGDIPALIAKLEADALALRERARDPAAGRRLATAVAALESLRLDLMRMQAGDLTLDELTTNVDAARRVGEEIDVQLDARREAADI